MSDIFPKQIGDFGDKSMTVSLNVIHWYYKPAEDRDLAVWQIQ